MTVSNRTSQLETSTEAESPNGDSPDDANIPADGNSYGTVETKRPALHIDIQIHIDPTSSQELIDHIFASMAKHLYGIKP